jgi:hypothetical protein
MFQSLKKVVTMEYLQQAMSVDEEGICQYTSCSLVGEETSIPIAQWERVLTLDYLVTSGVSGKW